MSAQQDERGNFVFGAPGLAGAVRMSLDGEVWFEFDRLDPMRMVSIVDESGGVAVNAALPGPLERLLADIASDGAVGIEHRFLAELAVAQDRWLLANDADRGRWVLDMVNRAMLAARDGWDVAAFDDYLDEALEVLDKEIDWLLLARDREVAIEERLLLAGTIESMTWYLVEVADWAGEDVAALSQKRDAVLGFTSLPLDERTDAGVLVYLGGDDSARAFSPELWHQDGAFGPFTEIGDPLTVVEAGSVLRIEGRWAREAVGPAFVRLVEFETGVVVESVRALSTTGSIRVELRRPADWTPDRYRPEICRYEAIRAVGAQEYVTRTGREIARHANQADELGLALARRVDESRLAEARVALERSATLFLAAADVYDRLGGDRGQSLRERAGIAQHNAGRLRPGVRLPPPFGVFHGHLGHGRQPGRPPADEEPAAATVIEIADSQTWIPNWARIDEVVKIGVWCRAPGAPISLPDLPEFEGWAPPLGWKMVFDRSALARNVDPKENVFRNIRCWGRVLIETSSRTDPSQRSYRQAVVTSEPRRALLEKAVTEFVPPISAALPDRVVGFRQSDMVEWLAFSRIVRDLGLTVEEPTWEAPPSRPELRYERNGVAVSLHPDSAVVGAGNRTPDILVEGDHPWIVEVKLTLIGLFKNRDGVRPNAPLKREVRQQLGEYERAAPGRVVLASTCSQDDAGAALVRRVVAAGIGQIHCLQVDGAPWPFTAGLRSAQSS